MTKKRNNDNALIIFVKDPVLGKAKTRIAKTLGDDKALAIYKQLIGITLHQCQGEGWDTILFVDGDTTYFEPFKVSIQPQITSPDLGLRMLDAISQTNINYKHVAIIGSDCPYITKDYIAQTFNKLSLDRNVVIGPSTDGGYYLLGCSDVHPSLFTDMVWSTASVLENTLIRCSKNNLTVYLLPTLTDIDTAEDWAAYLKINGKSQQL